MLVAKIRLLLATSGLLLLFVVLGNLFHLGARMNLLLQDPTLSSCLKERAIKINGKRFAICRIWQTAEGEFVHAYIYDETGELAKPPAGRSQEWTKKVRRYAQNMPFDIFIKMDCVAEKMFSSLYHAYFSYDILPVKN